MENKLKKSIIIIGLGLINLLHASLHIVQFIQSMILVRAATFGPKIEHQNISNIDMLLHSPYFAIIWAIVGIFTLIIGIKDFIHHRKCQHEKI
jgi:hypothetical protein